jgi:methyl coenzyme M reductase subunit C-like uncharacterized protein (methanogenesis marker protein 7)
MVGITSVVKKKLADAERNIGIESRKASVIQGLIRLAENGKKQLAKDPAISPLTVKDRESINVSIHAIEEFIAKHS